MESRAGQSLGVCAWLLTAIAASIFVADFAAGGTADFPRPLLWLEFAAAAASVATAAVAIAKRRSRRLHVGWALVLSVLLLLQMVLIPRINRN
jgi:hypothetical protein